MRSLIFVILWNGSSGMKGNNTSYIRGLRVQIFHRSIQHAWTCHIGASSGYFPPHRWNQGNVPASCFCLPSKSHLSHFGRVFLYPLSFYFRAYIKTMLRYRISLTEWSMIRLDRQLNFGNLPYYMNSRLCESMSKNSNRQSSLRNLQRKTGWRGY